MSDTNDHLFLVGGKSGAGKSASLLNLENPEGVMYLGTEAGKKLPFRSKFKEFKIVDPMQVEEAFTVAESMPDIHTIVVDTLSFLMDQYESLYVCNSANSMKAWGDYAQYFKRVMQQHVAKSTKNVIFLSHVSDVMNDESILETCVKVKGSIMNQGVEAYFSTVVSAKKVPLKKLKDNKSDLLTITPRDEQLGYKHVFQVQLTKDTVNERIRAPMGLWNDGETYIDNDCDKVLQRLREYYD